MLTEDQIYELALNRWRFSGHTHPGITRTVLLASPEDRATLQLFQEVNGQAQSVILNSVREHKPFTQDLFYDIFFGPR